ncbi:hypothetical protein [Enterococcus faecium]|uniref:hypothetical protein n=1 Tax=Enterococcus faecium TaxID=1352 RepID=UPI002073D116|nr:hypothetical protein [Enterococcus faecium]MCM6872069.1 hypothetical protein [Enterococcus faecium]MCM6877234.1 hypothetical protein [Enterococcus faecium]MCM6889945.1 hypothetical protein [Enterococcus faecium]MCM6892582.1 hypothetical protein [Enterococcus faecium]MCM6908927.1 hypothetical protein [Enterococcus faecium]
MKNEEKITKNIKIVQMILIACEFKLIKDFLLITLLLTFSVWLLDILLPSQYQLTDSTEKKSVFLPNSIRYSYWIEIVIQLIIIGFITWLI